MFTHTEKREYIFFLCFVTLDNELFGFSDDIVLRYSVVGIISLANRLDNILNLQSP